MTFLEGMRKGHHQSDISKVMLGEILKDEVEHMWVFTKHTDTTLD